MKKTFLIILAASTVLICIYLVLVALNQRSFSNNVDLGLGNKLTNQTVYVSDFMRFKIDVPNQFEVEETGFTIRVMNDSGEILISKNGTQFDTLKDHVNFGAQMNGLEMKSETQSSIDGYDSLKTVSKSGDGQIYYSHSIKVDDVVYGFSTESPDLYDELDQITQSFEYLGD